MKYVLAVVLSALLLTFTTPHPNNQVSAKQKRKTHTVSAAAPEKVAPAATPKTTATPASVTEQPLSSKDQLMQQAGIPQSDWEAVDYIVTHESSWNAAAVNASSGATGLCQALPASKMASAGADYKTNPVTQLRWCHDYAMTRYSGWWSAFAYWKLNRWW